MSTSTEAGPNGGILPSSGLSNATTRTTPPAVTSQAASASQTEGVTANPFAGIPDVANTDYYGNYANTIAATAAPGVFTSSVVGGTFTASPDAAQPNSGWLYTYTGPNGQTATGFNLVNAIGNFQNVFGTSAAAPGGTEATGSLLNANWGETFVPGTFTPAAVTAPGSNSGSGSSGTGGSTTNGGIDPTVAAILATLAGAQSAAPGATTIDTGAGTAPTLPLQPASPVVGAAATPTTTVNPWLFLALAIVAVLVYLWWHHHLAVAQGKGEAEGQAQAHGGGHGENPIEKDAKGVGSWLHSLI